MLHSNNLLVIGEPKPPVLKWKGVCLNAKVCETVTGDSVMNLIKENDVMHVEQSTISRDKRKITLNSNQLLKRMQVTFNKRMWPEKLDDISLPIGFQSIERL